MTTIAAITRMYMEFRLLQYPALKAELEATLADCRAHYQQAREDEAAAAQDVARLEAGRKAAAKHGDGEALVEFTVTLKEAKDRQAHAHTRRLEAYSDGMMARYRLDTVKRQAREAADKLGVSFIE